MILNYIFLFFLQTDVCNSQILAVITLKQVMIALHNTGFDITTILWPITDHNSVRLDDV